MYELINKVKELNPLVLHYTNNVTITDCANMTLAIGASPLMSFSYEEVEDMVSVASAVVINIGTMNSSYLDLFVKAGKAANKYNKPVVLDVAGKGVDSFDDGSDASEIVKAVAKKLNCTVVASGITDLVSDGEKVYKIFNGTAKLKKITGTGCMSSSLIASFLPCTDKPIEAAFMGTLSMSLSGELADITKPAVGTFKTYLFDNIDTLDVETFEKYAKVEL